MNQKLESFCTHLINRLSDGYCTSVRNDLGQISNYFGRIVLTEIRYSSEKLTIAVHQLGNHAHIMLLDKKISEIDKTTKPLVIFTVKFGRGSYGRLELPSSGRIAFTKLGPIGFNIFQSISREIYDVPFINAR